MSRFGLPPAVFDCLSEIFSHHPAIDAVKIYGSRAKGTAHPRSDIDLVLLGSSLDRHAVAALQQDIDDSDIPFQVDVQAFSSLQNRALIDHIDRIGQEIYRRERAPA